MQNYPSHKAAWKDHGSEIEWVGVVQAGEHSRRVECGSYTTIGSAICLNNVLLDSSEPIQNVIVEEKWTYLEQYLVWGKAVVFLRPLSTEERKANSHE